jgi:hypothetical protein
MLLSHTLIIQPLFFRSRSKSATLVLFNQNRQLNPLSKPDIYSKEEPEKMY